MTMRAEIESDVRTIARELDSVALLTQALVHAVPDRLLSIKEAAAYAGVSRRAIYNWMESGKLPFRRLPSGMRRIDPARLVSGEQRMARES